MASFNWQALLQIGIAFFFMTGKERERDSDRKKKKKRERERGAEMGWICSDNIEMQRERKRVRDKKNESEKEIGSNEEMETRERRERESRVADGERYVLGGERKVNKIIKRIIAFLSVRSHI